MKFLAFVGPSDSGKTTLVGKLAQYFNENLGYNEYPDGKIPSKLHYGFPTRKGDAYIVLEKDGKCVLFYSPSDTKELIKRLKKFLSILKEKGIEISLVVMGCRDASDHLYDFTFKTLNFEKDNPTQIPLGRMVRGDRRTKAMDHYIQSMHDLVSSRILPQILQEENL